MNDEVEDELRQAVSALLEARCPLDAVRALTEKGDGWDESLWRELVAMGVVGLPTAPQDGGEGGGTVLVVAVQEELGRRLAPVPLWSQVTAQAVLRAAGDTCSRELLRDVASGARTVVVTGRTVDGWTAAGTVRAVRDASGGWSLEGTVPVVAEATGATLHLVAAVSDEGPRWFAVDAATVRTVQGLDPTRPLADVVYASSARPVGGSDRFEAVLAAARRTALTVLAADAVGVADAATALAVQHAKERRQFERPIGSFQAVSHRLADMFIGVESARALVRAAAEAVDEGEEDAAPRQDVDLAVEVAASHAFDAAVAAAQGCVQVHGGMGITWEHAAHSYLRRAKADSALVAWPDRLRDLAAGRLTKAARERIAASDAHGSGTSGGTSRRGADVTV